MEPQTSRRNGIDHANRFVSPRGSCIQLCSSNFIQSNVWCAQYLRLLGNTHEFNGPRFANWWRVRGKIRPGCGRNLLRVAMVCITSGCRWKHALLLKRYHDRDVEAVQPHNNTADVTTQHLFMKRAIFQENGYPANKTASEKDVNLTTTLLCFSKHQPVECGEKKHSAKLYVRRT